jgi:hypothetical protein
MQGKAIQLSRGADHRPVTTLARRNYGLNQGSGIGELETGNWKLETVL